VTTVLSWPEPTRRAAARARAEHFGWPAAVRAFLAIHEALVAGEAEGGDRLAVDVARPGDRLAAGEAEGRGQVADGVAAGAGAGTGVRTERRPT
jgi:alpha-1,6-mannosyltransferase